MLIGAHIRVCGNKIKMCANSSITLYSVELDACLATCLHVDQLASKILLSALILKMGHSRRLDETNRIQIFPSHGRWLIAIQEKTFSFSQTTRQHSLSVYRAIAPLFVWFLDYL